MKNKSNTGLIITAIVGVIGAAVIGYLLLKPKKVVAAPLNTMPTNSDFGDISSGIGVGKPADKTIPYPKEILANGKAIDALNAGMYIPVNASLSGMTDKVRILEWMYEISKAPNYKVTWKINNMDDLATAAAWQLCVQTGVCK